MQEIELFDNYELLLPSPHEGGYLILSIYSQVEAGQLNEQFTAEDIKVILEKISRRCGAPIPQAERLIRQLLHYCLRNVPDEYGKFELSDHAIRLVELMQYKLENPYKNYPLQETFEKYFILRAGEIKTITELEVKFGREFSAGHKRIVTDHLTTLEDELIEAYNELNAILNADEESATIMVRKFTDVFRTFGERADDITRAISSKDVFLRRMRHRIDEFYMQADVLKHAQSEEDLARLRQYQQEWVLASSIQRDLEQFFKTVDGKIDRIRRQILKASNKLSELQENFSRKSNFRLMLKRLYHLCIDQAQTKRGQICFNSSFPSKQVVYERVQLFHPVRFDFGTTRNSRLQIISKDPEYERQQRRQIELEIRRQEIINHWVEKGKKNLQENAVLELHEFIAVILKEERDVYIAQNVAMDLVAYAAISPTHNLNIQTELQTYFEHNLWTWKMTIQNPLVIHS